MQVVWWVNYFIFISRSLKIIITNNYRLLYFLLDWMIQCFVYLFRPLKARQNTKRNVETMAIAPIIITRWSIFTSTSYVTSSLIVPANLPFCQQLYTFESAKRNFLKINRSWASIVILPFDSSFIDEGLIVFLAICHIIGVSLSRFLKI